MIIRKDKPTKLELLKDFDFCKAKLQTENEFLTTKTARTYEINYEVDSKTGDVYWYTEVGY